MKEFDLIFNDLEPNFPSLHLMKEPNLQTVDQAYARFVGSPAIHF